MTAAAFPLLTTELDRICEDYSVDLDYLMGKITAGIQGVSIAHFTDDELRVIQSAIEIAGEF